MQPSSDWWILEFCIINWYSSFRMNTCYVVVEARAKAMRELELFLSKQKDSSSVTQLYVVWLLLQDFWGWNISLMFGFMSLPTFSHTYIRTWVPPKCVWRYVWTQAKIHLWLNDFHKTNFTNMPARTRSDDGWLVQRSCDSALQGWFVILTDLTLSRLILEISVWLGTVYSFVTTRDYASPRGFDRNHLSMYEPEVSTQSKIFVSGNLIKGTAGDLRICRWGEGRAGGGAGWGRGRLGEGQARRKCL